jgi:drug/metabolite transporter (DMT)-like permease
MPPSTPTDERSSAQPRAAGFTSTDLVLLLMALIWGVNISVVKYGTTAMPPLSYNAIRVSLAAVALVLLGSMVRQPWPERRIALRLLALGVIGNGIYQILFVEGVARTKAGNAALVLAATPALIALFSRMKGIERLSMRGLAGIGLSIAGVLLVVGTGAVNATRETFTGDALVLGGCVCWAAFTVLLKPYMHQVQSMHLAALTMLGGLLPLYVVAIPDLAGLQWAAVPAMAWLSMIFSGLGALVLAYLLWYRGVRILGPTRTAMYANLQPAIALAFAWPLLGEVPTPIQGLGAAGIITGLLLART